MELTEEQKAEIKDYIITVPKYRETYNELYDHILNSLKDNVGPYHINKVIAIINDEFGGFSEILSQEKIYQKELGKKYNTYFRLEMLHTFKWPEMLNNLCLLGLCLLIYSGAKDEEFNMMPMFLASIICVAGVALFGFLKILLNKFRWLKYSILDNYIGYSCSFGFVIMNFFLLNFIGKTSFFTISDSSKLIITLSLFFFCSVYVRAFMRFYQQKIKILTVQ
ncbi:hypothetical protein [Pedobacter sp. Hv1]|uniref:hypothetical protein n=1 Tax=Pedobacter sp. Hv1 TaxID=1740090 RepID=UPI0006D8CF27|nr:hypothetical protein [Pedobacter sp. Hv1]KQC00241.1 hypothetical protein AQF98_12110 [Pedobacter sp. Hv1]